jgi:hypothetical protein
MDSVGRTSAKSHGGNATVKGRRASGFEKGIEDVGYTNRFNGARPDCLHMGLDCVNREHGHVFYKTGY